jgi:hypothetical protein
VGTGCADDGAEITLVNRLKDVCSRTQVNGAVQLSGAVNNPDDCTGSLIVSADIYASSAKASITLELLSGTEVTATWDILQKGYSLSPVNVCCEVAYISLHW